MHTLSLYTQALSPVTLTDAQISSEAPSVISVQVFSTSEQAVFPVSKIHFVFGFEVTAVSQVFSRSSLTSEHETFSASGSLI